MSCWGRETVCGEVETNVTLDRLQEHKLNQPHSEVSKQIQLQYPFSFETDVWKIAESQGNNTIVLYE